MRLLVLEQTCQKFEQSTEDVISFHLKSMTISSLRFLHLGSKSIPVTFWLRRFMYRVFLTQSNVCLTLEWFWSSCREGFVSMFWFHMISDYSLTKVPSSFYRHFWKNLMSFLTKYPFFYSQKKSDIIHYSVMPVYLSFKTSSCSGDFCRSSYPWRPSVILSHKLFCNTYESLSLY